MQCRTSLLLYVLSLQVLFTASILGGGRSVDASQDVLCRLTVVHTLFADKSSSHELACIPVGANGETDDAFPIDVPGRIQKWFDTSENRYLYLTIHGAVYEEEDASLQVLQNATFTFYEKIPDHIRSLRSTSRSLSFTAEGIRSLGVVRISTTERDGFIHSPTYSAKELYRGIFGHGYNGDGVTVSSQYNLCSGGKLSWVPTDVPVREVTLPDPVSTYTASSMYTAVQKKLKAELGLTRMAEYANNTMFITPEFENNLFLALAPTGHWRSIYHNEWGLYLVANMHEIGHNFWLGHADEDGQTQQAKEGNMGLAGNTGPGFPLKCFNACNNRNLGWFEDRSLVVAKKSLTLGPQLIKVAAFVDYDVTESDEPVNVGLEGTGSGSAYCMHYNRATKHNRGTQEHGDMLTITQQGEGGGTNHIAALDIGQKVDLISGLRVQVCERINGDTKNPDALIVSVSINDDDGTLLALRRSCSECTLDRVKSCMASTATSACDRRRFGSAIEHVQDAYECLFDDGCCTQKDIHTQECDPDEPEKTCVPPVPMCFPGTAPCQSHDECCSKVCFADNHCGVDETKSRLKELFSNNDDRRSRGNRRHLGSSMYIRF